MTKVSQLQHIQCSIIACWTLGMSKLDLFLCHISFTTLLVNAFVTHGTIAFIIELTKVKGA